MAAAGSAAIVLGDVNMKDLLDVVREGGDRILLLDVGVERVVHHPEVGMVDVAHQAVGVGRTVQEVDLESVEVLDR